MRSRRDTACVSSAEREPEASAEKATTAQLAEKTWTGDLQWLMGDVRGRRFMWRLLGRSGIYRTSFTGEALSMAFREGERNVAIVLMDEITRHCPKRLSEMQTEARTHERRNANSKHDAAGD